MVCFAIAHDSNLAVTNVAQPHPSGPGSSQDDVDHALGFQRHVFLFPCRLGFVLAIQQYIVHCTAVDDQQAAWRYKLSHAE